MQSLRRRRCRGKRAPFNHLKGPRARRERERERELGWTRTRGVGLTYFLIGAWQTFSATCGRSGWQPVASKCGACIQLPGLHWPQVQQSCLFVPGARPAPASQKKGTCFLKMRCGNEPDLTPKFSDVCVGVHTEQCQLGPKVEPYQTLPFVHDMSSINVAFKHVQFQVGMQQGP